MRILANFLVIVVIVVAGCNDNAKQLAGPETTERPEIEKMKLLTLQGEPVDLTKYKGKAVFINFWATWCKPCVEEMPTIKNAIANLKDADIEFMFASDEKTEEIEAFEREHNFGFTYLKASDIQNYGILALPTTMIFDNEGKKIFSELGYRKWDDKENLDRLLQASK